MSLALVSPDGKYHGHTENLTTAVQAKTQAKRSDLRALNEEEWAQVVANRDQRAELCAKLGTTL